jgi:hypothetical protein
MLHQLQMDRNPSSAINSWHSSILLPPSDSRSILHYVGPLTEESQLSLTYLYGRLATSWTQSSTTSRMTITRTVTPKISIVVPQNIFNLFSSHFDKLAISTCLTRSVAPNKDFDLPVSVTMNYLSSLGEASQ